MALDEDFLARMREATQLLQTGGPVAATAAIQSALQGASAVSRPNPAKTNAASPSVLPPAMLVGRTPPARRGVEKVEEDAPVVREGKGSFQAASCSNDAGTRAYELYVPSGHEGQALPLIVMLHGCTQSPHDFAAGTGMNALAEKHGCLVVYPAQAQAAHGSNCWNWFKPADQQRDLGEPSILADITREVIRQHHADPARVYVAGLSAGGAMAAIMGARYPELYAAVGIHSGLPVGAAHDLPSALAAMKNGAVAKDLRKVRRRPIPAIVFHGDRDARVHPRNGEQALAQCIGHEEHEVTVQQGKVPHGRAYTKTVRRDRNGKAIAEQWVVHGAGHAWSGGKREGSYTDPKGPDAAREMLRFFFMHRQGER